jgi:hypothetical protein
MIQKFLDGKKKYSAFIITILATLIPLFIQAPEAQTELMDMVPSIAAFLTGIFYIITQGGIDKQKEKTATEFYKAQAAAYGTGTGMIAAPNVVQAQPAQPQQEIKPIDTSQPEISTNLNQSQPLDIKLFHERVLNDTAAKYSELNPATVFFEARDKGSVTTCYGIKQAQDYWDYLVTLAYSADQYAKEQTSEVKPGEGPACKVQSPDYVYMQLELAKTLRNRDYVCALAQTNIDWRRKLYPNDTLYHVGVLAEELLQ